MGALAVSLASGAGEPGCPWSRAEDASARTSSWAVVEAEASAPSIARAIAWFLMSSSLAAARAQTRGRQSAVWPPAACGRQSLKGSHL